MLLNNSLSMNLIGNGGAMKDKIPKTDKAGGPPETKSDITDDIKKEPAGVCDDNSGKNGEQNISVNKNSERGFLECKTETVVRQEDLKEDEGMHSSKNKNDGLGDNVLFPTDNNENLMLGAGGEGPGSQACSGPVQGQQGGGPGVQPLASNVINKQPGTMDTQYMQQQSQIFVFSTTLANKAADNVLQGQFPSIIAYHCAQPGTKKYLEKHPLKLNQFNRQNPAQWLNSMAQLKQKCFGGPPGPSGSGPLPPNMAPKGGRNVPDMGPMPGGPGPRMMAPCSNMHDLDMQEASDMAAGREMHHDFPPMAAWNQQGGMNHNNMGCGGPGPIRPTDKSCMGRPPQMEPYPSVSPYTLTGTKVPNENLTPQQRQHREEQLATLRKINQMLFPENQSQPPDEFGNPRMMMPHNPADGPPNGNANGPPHGNRPHRVNLEAPLGSPMMNPPSGMVGSPLVNPSNNMGMSMGDNEGMSQDPMNPMQKMNPNQVVAAQMEWKKLQEQFYEDRKRKGLRTDSPIPRGSGGANCIKMPPGMGGMPPQMQGVMPPMQGNMPPMPGCMPPMQGNLPPGMGGMPPQMPGGMPPQMPGGMPPMQGNMAPMQGNMMPQMQAVMPTQNMSGMQGPPPPYHQTSRSSSVPITGASPAPESPSNAASNPSLPSPRNSSELNSPSDVNKMVKMNTCSPVNNQGSPSCAKIPASNPGTPVSASQSPTPNKEIYNRGKAGKPTGNGGNKEPNLMPVPSPQQIQYLNAFEGQELTIQKQPNTSLKEPNTSSPLSHASLSETPKCKTPNAINSPGQQQGSPRYQQIQQQQVPQQQPQLTGPMTPHNTVPSNKGDGNGLPPSPDHSGPSPCRQPSDNMPLNPNGLNCPPNSKALHFDPITSLAQMSQQLTNQAPSCQGPHFPPNNMMSMDQGMHMEPMDNMTFIPQQAPSMMDVPPGYMSNPSPKPMMGTPPVRCAGPPYFAGQQYTRMMGPSPYNGMNVQVKPNAPNTIQYLPPRPSGNSPLPAPRNAPSLDFLQRFANPGPEGKPPMFMGNCHPGPGPMDQPNPNMMMGGNMLRGQIRPGMKPGPQNMGKPPGPQGFDMPMNPQGMYKVSPLGMPPDASQPLPPSMSQGNNFKNSPFVGPTISDPNYAQQFHNFQQQLYATNTRSQLNSHLNQSYFMPK